MSTHLNNNGDYYILGIIPITILVPFIPSSPQLIHYLNVFCSCTCSVFRVTVRGPQMRTNKRSVAPCRGGTIHKLASSENKLTQMRPKIKTALRPLIVAKEDAIWIVAAPPVKGNAVAKSFIEIS